MNTNSQYITFKLTDGEYALPLMHVKEILKPLPITKIPNSNVAIRGIATVRNNVITIMDLHEKFGIIPAPSETEPRIIIVEFEGHVIGLWVDDVVGISNTENEDIETMPNIIHNNAISEVIKTEHNIVPIINISSLFNDEVLQMILPYEGISS